MEVKEVVVEVEEKALGVKTRVVEVKEEVMDILEKVIKVEEVVDADNKNLKVEGEVVEVERCHNIVGSSQYRGGNRL